MYTGDESSCQKDSWEAYIRWLSTAEFGDDDDESQSDSEEKHVSEGDAASSRDSKPVKSPTRDQESPENLRVCKSAGDGGAGRKRKSRWEPLPDREGDRPSMQKKRSRWSPEKPFSVQSHFRDVKKLSLFMDPEFLDLKIKLVEINKKLRTGQVLDDKKPIRFRSPSPEPVYDNFGNRVNSRENRAREKLNQERQLILDRLAKKGPSFKATSKRKFSTKVYIPPPQYPEYNPIGIVLGPQGLTQQKVEKETGAKLYIRGKAMGTSVSPYTKPVGDEKLHVRIEAESEISLNRAASMVRSLLFPVGGGQSDLKPWKAVSLDGNSRANEVCHYCKQLGHYKNECPLKTRSFAHLPTHPNGGILEHCNKAHGFKVHSLGSGLPGTKGGMSGGELGLPAVQAARLNDNSRANEMCHYCKQLGHYKNECPLKARGFAPNTHLPTHSNGGILEQGNKVHGFKAYSNNALGSGLPGTKDGMSGGERVLTAVQAGRLNGNSRANEMCHYCKQLGHYKNECPLKARSSASNTHLPTGGNLEQGNKVHGFKAYSNNSLGSGLLGTRGGLSGGDLGLPAVQNPPLVGIDSALDEDYNETHVYIGNLPLPINDAGLVRLFLPFGQVTHAKVIRDNGSGLHTGYGFVRFLKAADARQAVSVMNGYRLDDKVLQVRLKVPLQVAASGSLSPRQESQEELIVSGALQVYAGMPLSRAAQVPAPRQATSRGLQTHVQESQKQSIPSSATQAGVSGSYLHYDYSHVQESQKQSSPSSATQAGVSGSYLHYDYSLSQPQPFSSSATQGGPPSSYDYVPQLKQPVSSSAIDQHQSRKHSPSIAPHASIAFLPPGVPTRNGTTLRPPNSFSLAAANFFGQFMMAAAAAAAAAASASSSRSPRNPDQQQFHKHSAMAGAIQGGASGGLPPPGPLQGRPWGHYSDQGGTAYHTHRG